MMEELTATLGKALAKRLDGFRFVKSRWHLIRQTEAGWQAIAIEALPTSNPAIAKLAAHGQVRIEALEATYAPHHPFIGTKEVKNHQTLTINCDELLTDKSLVDGFSTDSQHLETFVNDYSAALTRDVLPWLDKYSDENAIYEGLTDDDPMKWITSDRLTRYPVLLTILARRCAWEAFDRVATEFSKYCDQPHAQVYKPIAESIITGLRNGGPRQV
jgi:hypothetical protein